MKENKKTRIVLIGGGPACVTAAIQLSRSGMKPMLLSENIGGTIKNANLIENLLGFPEGISGEDYVTLIQKQLEKNDVQVILEKVEKVTLLKNEYEIITSKSRLLADQVIIGTGSKPKKLNVKGEEKAWEKNLLFYEIFNLKSKVIANKKITIIGSGDVAYDYALNLCKSMNLITIIQRQQKTKSLPVLQERVREQENITFLKDREPMKVEMEDDKIILTILNEGREEQITSNYILVAIGREPNISFLDSKLVQQYENPKDDFGLYFVGDVKLGNFRQVSISMGDGMKAAMEIIKKE